MLIMALGGRLTMAMQVSRRSVIVFLRFPDPILLVDLHRDVGEACIAAKRENTDVCAVG